MFVNHLLESMLFSPSCRKHVKISICEVQERASKRAKVEITSCDTLEIKSLRLRLRYEDGR